MKTILTWVFSLLLTGFLFAQSGINYKAIIKDGGGNILANQTVDVQFIIYEGAALTNNVYQESHTKNSDANGIIVINIGEGTTTDVFADVAWGQDEHWLNVQIDTGTGLVDMGTTQFMAVPYALSSGDNYWSKSGNEIYTINNSVGINRANPEHTLDVRSGSLTEAAGFNLSNSDKSKNLRFFSGNDTFPDPSMSWAPGNNLLFATYDDNTFDFQEKMRISSTGNVGIGVIDPQAKLEVDGKIKIGNDSNSDEEGTIRYNSTTADFEGYNGSTWVSLTKYDNTGGWGNSTVTQNQISLASDGAADDNFGNSVAIDGDASIVGAYGDDDNGTSSGSAYIFVKSAGTGSIWIEQAKLTASDGAEIDFFGRSVAISGNTAIIGAYLDDDNGTESGSAYIFVRSGSTWTEQTKLTASDGVADDYFGWSVAISGNTAIISAYQDDDNGTSSGSAYIFVRSGTTWTQQAKLTASDGAVSDNFGFSVTIAGDTAIVGSHLDDDNGSASGSAYIFVRSGTTWTEQAKLTASDGAEFDQFGRSVAISGDSAIIGASRDDDNGGDSGSAYIFVRSGTTWTEQAKLTTSDGAVNDNFGTSVDITGDTVIIGAQSDDDNGVNSGSAYIFVFSGTTWTQQAKLAASSGAAGDIFGSSVAIDGDASIVGASGDDDNGNNAGSVYFFQK